MSQRTEVSRLNGKFLFMVDVLCTTGDMLSAQLGPVSRGEDLRVSIYLPDVSVYQQELPAEFAGLVMVRQFVIEVEATLSQPLTLRSPAAGTDPSRTDPEFARQHDWLSETASDVAHDFLTWVRLRLRQFWVAPTGTPNPQASYIWDADSKEEISARQEPSPGMRIPSTLLTSVPGRAIPMSGPTAHTSLNKILAGEAAGNIGLPERLLSSAFGKLWSAYPDPQTAVFLAVVACETKVKTVLGMDITSGGKPLIYYFDNRCKAVIGRSLSEENEPLRDKLKILIGTRNDVVHQGFELTVADAEGCLATATEVFGWLDSGSY